MAIVYCFKLENVNWDEMKTTLRDDKFDNGRDPEQLRISFENSHSCCIAYDGGRIIGTARVLSDGVCNAYMVDVWTFSLYRRRGIARSMIEQLLNGLHGQHVYLFSDDAVEFYKKVGFVERPTGLEQVVGNWLQIETK